MKILILSVNTVNQQLTPFKLIFEPIIFSYTHSINLYPAVLNINAHI